MTTNVSALRRKNEELRAENAKLKEEAAQLKRLIAAARELCRTNAEDGIAYLDAIEAVEAALPEEK